MHRLTSTLLERDPGKFSRTFSLQLSPLRHTDNELPSPGVYILPPQFEDSSDQAFPTLFALGRRLEAE